MRAWTARERTAINHIDQRQHARYGVQNVTAPSVQAAAR